MFLSAVVKYTRLTFIMLHLNLKSTMEYRASFITQFIAMIISDVVFACIWFIFFKRFPTVQGWTFKDVMLLLSLSSLNWGLVCFFALGTLFLARNIANGDLDHQLTLPKNILWLIATSKSSFATSFGDLAFGVVTYFFAGQLAPIQQLSFVLMVFLTAIIMFNFVVITQSMGFFAGNFEDAADQFCVALLFGTYTPQAGMHGLLKVIMLTIVPVFIVAAIPVDFIRSCSWTALMIVMTATIISSILAMVIFKQGLKRYESGNLINVKL